MRGYRNYYKKIILIITALILILNVTAIFHSYRFTHFNEKLNEPKNKAEELSFLDKLNTMVFGVKNPRPTNKAFPSKPFKTVNIESNKLTSCWFISVPDSRGTVLLFHGYGGSKSSLLDKSDVFNDLGFNTFLVDFMGSGESEGNQTTIGYYESKQVKSAFEYLKTKGEKNLFLFGTSMGAVASLKAIRDYEIMPSGLIIECPFGSLYETVNARFKILNVPAFPMSALIIFWGGVINNFNGFSHNPIDYAKNVNCPTLLLYGEKDRKVSKREIDLIYKNLNGYKTLKLYPNAGHENYLIKYPKEWSNDVKVFLNEVIRTNEL